MGIRFTCPSGHKLHVKAFLAGKRAVCPHCGAKFVVPTLRESQQASAQPPANSLQHDPGEAFTSTSVVAPPDTASASIIIATTDERLDAAPAADRDSSEIRLADSFGSPTTADSPVPPPTDPAVLPPPPTISTEIGTPESPAALHVARRQRHRRQQLNMAIVLLATVILLALVLIWVLQHGTSVSSAGAPKIVQLGNAWPCFIVRSDHLSSDLFPGGTSL